MAQLTAVPRRRSFALLTVALLAAGLLGVLVLVQQTTSRDDGPAPIAGAAASPRVAYFEFGLHADTLWLAEATNPDARERLFSVAHAPEYGIVPSLAPDGRRAAYTVLPPSTMAPGPDAPAELWLAPIGAETSPSLLAENVDLLVAPVWSPDGQRVVFRRSGGKANGQPFELAATGPSGGAETTLAGDAAALFPVAFSPDGGTFYYVRLQEQGSELLSVPAAGGKPSLVARLSDGLTRDWALSPDGSRLAYLEVSFGAVATSRARVLDLASGESTAVGDPGKDAFKPVWDARGHLVLGQLAAGAQASPLIELGPEAEASFAAPSRGFDVPLDVAPGGLIAARSFDGASAVDPGRAALIVIDGEGTRHQIASGEVTFLGWITS